MVKIPFYTHNCLQQALQPTDIFGFGQQASRAEAYLPFYVNN